MSASEPPTPVKTFNDETYAELFDHLLERENRGDDEPTIEDLDVPEEVREELLSALAARDLLAQLAPVNPPGSLPSQTARRARRRLRLQRSQEGRGRLDGLVTVAVIALVLGIVFSLIYQLREISRRGHVEVIKLEEPHQKDESTP